MLTATHLLQSIELDLGYKFTNLEITHDEIMQIIISRTLPEFSKYFPYQERIRINTQTDLVPEYKNRYFLDSENEIININRLIGPSKSSPSDIIDGNPNPLTYGSSNFLERQLIADLSSATNPITFEYHHPGMIEIAPITSMSSSYIIVANVMHPAHLGTIPTNMQDYFRQLASLDVKSALYLLRNRFQNMQTTFGSIELFVDDLSQAMDKREELVSRMQKSSILSSKRKKIFIG